MFDTGQPYLSINPQRIVTYTLFESRGKRETVQKLTGKAIRAGQNGLSARASKNMAAAINALTYSAPWKTVYVRSEEKHYRYKVNFITLTLPSLQLHSDKEIVKECLSPFLEAWQKKAPGLLYVWKAEVQDNGNLHFHITSNMFYHHKALRDDWNRFINKLGYVDRSVSSSPNSTDVHSVRNIKNLAAYMATYLTKKDNHTKVLKRYHRMYKQKLLAYRENLFPLPKNYLKHIKRKVSCSIWSASKPLLASTVSFHAHTEGIRQDMAPLYSLEQFWFKGDYFSVLFLEKDAFPMLKNVYKAWKAANSALFIAQAKGKRYVEMN